MQRLERLAEGAPQASGAPERGHNIEVDLVEEQMQRIERQTAVLERSIEVLLPTRH